MQTTNQEVRQRFTPHMNRIKNWKNWCAISKARPDKYRVRIKDNFGLIELHLEERRVLYSPNGGYPYWHPVDSQYWDTGLF